MRFTENYSEVDAPLKTQFESNQLDSKMRSNRRLMQQEGYSCLLHWQSVMEGLSPGLSPYP